MFTHILIAFSKKIHERELKKERERFFYAWFSKVQKKCQTFNILRVHTPLAFESAVEMPVVDIINGI